MKQQSNIRRQKRHARKALSLIERQNFSHTICKKIITSTSYQQAHRVAAYIALPEEVSTAYLIAQTWQQQKQLYLPVVMRQQAPLAWAPYSADSQMTKDSLGMTIPDSNADTYIKSEALEVVIVPLVAFDENCRRIGMGGGFYDRSFASRKQAAKTRSQPVLIGIGFECQKSATPINSQPWDTTVDMIITEENQYLNTSSG